MIMRAASVPISAPGGLIVVRAGLLAELKLRLPNPTTAIRSGISMAMRWHSNRTPSGRWSLEQAIRPLPESVAWPPVAWLHRPRHWGGGMLNDVRVDADDRGGGRETFRVQCCTPIFLHACAKKEQVLATALYQIAFERCLSQVVRGDDGAAPNGGPGIRLAKS